MMNAWMALMTVMNMLAAQMYLEHSIVPAIKAGQELVIKANVKVCVFSQLFSSEVI